MDSLLIVVRGIALTVLAFGLMVCFHELGHFLAAKLIGVRVDRFSFGLGPKVWGKKLGETEYMVSWVPIGGYVKLAGGDEGEEATGAPDEFVSKSPGQRAIVLVAGPLFSILLGIPTAMGMLVAGRDYYNARVSDVVVASPAWDAGIRYGDRIAEIDGSKVETFEDVRRYVATSQSDTAIDLVVKRDGETRTLKARRPKGAQLGVSCTFHSLRIREVVSDSPAEAAGVLPDDVIVSVNGERVREWMDFRRRILPHADETIKLGLERDGRPVTLEVKPEGIDRKSPGFDVKMPTEIGYVRDGFPAHGKLLVGDRITAVNGESVDSWWDLEDKVREGQETVTLAVERGEEPGVLEVAIARGPGQRAADSLGIAPRPVYIITKVHRLFDPPLYAGDVIVEVGGQDVADVIREQALYTPRDDLLHFLGRAGRVTVLRDGQEVVIDYEAEPVKIGQIGVVPAADSTFRKLGFFASIVPAVRQTGSMLTFGVVIIGKLITGDIKFGNLMGPVGILQHTYLSATRGWAELLRLVHLITVSIGVFNLLPMPPLDGGRIVMLAYEKLRGKRPSRKLQEAILLAGVAVVLMIFVVATFNDVQRWILGS